MDDLAMQDVTELEQDKQKIRNVCLEAIRNKRAKLALRLQAASLLSSIQGLYGPGRPRVSAREGDSGRGAGKLNNRGNTEAGTRTEWLSRLLENVDPVAEACNDDATPATSR
jgi:hypothetical protein